MTEIYCVKCREITKTNAKSESKEITKKGRNRLTGICTICGTKKGMFVNRNWGITKTSEELEEARNLRLQYSLRKKAEKIGWKVLANPDAKECVNRCLAKAKKNNN